MLHAGILPLVNVPLFGEQMTALYLLFLAPDELDRLARPPRSSGLVRPAAERVGCPVGAARPGPCVPGWRQLELAFEAGESRPLKL